MDAGFGTGVPLGSVPVVFSKYCEDVPRLVMGTIYARDAESLQRAIDNEWLKQMGIAGVDGLGGLI